MIAVTCAHCGLLFMKERGQHNRSVRRGMPEYCGRSCFGVTRRNDPNITSAERLASAEYKAAKAKYDAARREQLADVIRGKKKVYYLANRDALMAKAREQRADPATKARRRAIQARVTNTARWRAHKAEYDRRRRAEQYGEFGEAAAVLAELQRAVVAAVPDKHERSRMRYVRGRANRATKARRERQ